MSIKIGWSPRRSDRERRGLRLFEYVNIKKAGGRMFAVGVVHMTRRELERLREKERVVDVRVIGLLRFSSGVTPALVDATIGRVDVTGKIVAPSELGATITRHRTATA